jgi:glycosyltransferase involved in cell wall biosynthesis
MQGRRAVAMLAHSYYDEDPRVRREAEALVRVGYPVDVFALRRPGDAAGGDVLGVSIHRLDVQRHQGAPLATYLREYLSFFFRAAMALASAHRRRPYALVQVHTLPDFLVFAVAPIKLAGVPIVLDLHEAMPELFHMRFPRASIAPLRVLVEMQESLSIAFADAVITVTAGVADRLHERGASPEKVTVIHNSPSTALFHPGANSSRPFMSDGSLHLIYTGVLSPIYELEVALEAIARIREERPGLPVRFDVYGRGDYE